MLIFGKLTEDERLYGILQQDSVTVHMAHARLLPLGGFWCLGT
jgi:hypothetical protein